jgi:hypothetical protein
MTLESTVRLYPHSEKMLLKTEADKSSEAYLKAFMSRLVDLFLEFKGDSQRASAEYDDIHRKL